MLSALTDDDSDGGMPLSRGGKALMVAMSTRRPAPGARQGDAPSSFAAYMRHRPEPMDRIERALLRLDWLRWRVARRRPA